MENLQSNSKATKLQLDIMRPVNWSMGFKAWMGFLTALLGVCLYFYIDQLLNGLTVTGMTDYVSWGMYISNFVFFVAVSLVGMLISSVLGLSGAKWITPITRIAEIVAVSFAMVAGLIIISDMGRPDRAHHLLLYGRLQSPILWDVTVVTTYVFISLLLYYLPLIPDLALMRDKAEHLPKWQRNLYGILSIGWKGTDEQFKIIKKSMRTLLILIIPVALAIHTVTSWLFASTLRIGWDSSIFGPYFVAGAFVAGSAAVIVAMFFFQRNYKLSEYITEKHFDNMGKLLVLVSLVYLYFNINEILVPAYKMKAGDDEHLYGLFHGHWAGMFWFAQIGGLIIPILLLLLKPMRKPLPMLIISLFVIAGSWIKRYIIVIPTMLHPHLPIQNVPEAWHHYHPTLHEIMITIAPFVLALLIASTLAKLFPVIPVWEVEHELEEEGK